MTTDNRYFYELTKYPKLFNDTYWGGFKWENELILTGMIDVANNRNQFVEKNGIIKRIRLHPTRMKKYLKQFELPQPDMRDHIEHYKTRNGFICCIFSNYENTINPDICIQHGYTQTDNLYSSETTTFIKIIPR